MREFFDLLRQRGLSPERMEATLTRSSRTQMLDLVEEIRFTLPYTLIADAGRHSFVANTSLSGGPFPCRHVDCRREKADDLARFAALYADRVLIRDPYSLYNGRDWYDNVLRTCLAGDFLVFFYLEPLFENGLLGVGSPVLPYSESHHSQERDVSHTLQRFNTWLRDKYLDEIEFQYDKSTGLIVVEGPEFIVPHGKQFWGPCKEDVLTQRGAVRKRVKKGIFEDNLVGPAVRDITEQGAYARHSHYTYLTDGDLDADLISSITDEKIHPTVKAVIKGLSHAVPVVASTDLRSLLRLREEEAEAFRVYRDSVSRVLQNADLTSERRIEEAFADAIQPELNRIDLAVRNSRKLFSDHLTRDFIVGAGMISIGFSIGAVQPTAGALFAAAGGVKSAYELGKRVYDAARSDTSEIRNNSFYYLWQLRQNSEISQASVEKKWF